MFKLISGKEISLSVKERVAEEVKDLKKNGIEPCLAVILVGDDPASKVYVNNKKKACEFCGIRSLEYILPADASQEELNSLVEKLNSDESVNGILCQLPLPSHLDEKEVLNLIKPEKDVDAFHPENVGHIMIGDFNFLPCTPAGIMEMLKYENIGLDGKNCVIIGRSNIVGKPMAMLMLKENATVTVCHSHTKNLKEVVARADVVVAAVGKAKFVTADMIKDGAVIIDVGINRCEDGKLYGDVDFEACKEKASYITPVPGGVGPMTIATLMQNTVTAAKIQKG
ncbi:MAG: bifunctional methylenetetrahydrofolate dehydrogenase/methenyltetrahydrofolate cyclohydrolase FolD [Clostridiaceae bacterium]|nr:bifunctional methylenetetrahydrofolate dehydrogenase/methenyltetrahydrofolate cyclohydrolase FolD [Clostridiaceae bacterium]MDY5889500.1 bifunctional methylenetetrahydrofolate dehydrogenase/methenyltetrahydrofolate cyclohydrolase FolD [Oscillospiraceae bacterium]